MASMQLYKAALFHVSKVSTDQQKQAASNASFAYAKTL